MTRYILFFAVTTELNSFLLGGDVASNLICFNVSFLLIVGKKLLSICEFLTV